MLYIDSETVTTMLTCKQMKLWFLFWTLRNVNQFTEALWENLIFDASDFIKAGLNSGQVASV